VKGAVKDAAQRDPLTRIAARIAPHKFDTLQAGPNRITEERPFSEFKGSLFGLEVGVTFSELHQIRAQKGIELIHVVNPEGGSNVELVLARKELGKKQRLELQGPAVNTSLSPGDLPLGVRVVGVGLTSDVIDHQAKEAVSYTAEVKVTERTALEAGLMTGLFGGGSTVAELFAAAVPGISAALFVSSARWAWKTYKNPRKTRVEKGLALAHAASDGVRIVFPMTGTLANAALVGVSTAMGYGRIRQMRRRAQAAEAR